MKKLAKIFPGLMSLMALAVGQAASAQDDKFGLGYAANVGLGTQEIRAVAANVINVLLGILGILALIIVLYGGFRWMTSAGNEENVAAAKKTIGAGLVGLIIIFFAYAIVLFVFNVVGSAV